MQQLTEADLAELAHLLPYNAQQLVQRIGAAAAVALLNRWPGVTFVMPKGTSNAAGAARWAQLVGIVGAEATEILARWAGGDVLKIPTCDQLRTEKRNRWIRARYDAITAPAGGGYSKAVAVHLLGMELAADGHVVSYRGIERVLDTPGPLAAAVRVVQRQRGLFDEAAP
jgi:hypothetical protein